MKISNSDWIKLKNRLAAIDKKAYDEMLDWLQKNGGYESIPREDIISRAYALATKYGEASASLSAMMYDRIAELSNVIVPLAEVADTVEFGEVAKAVNGIIKNKLSDKELSSAVGRFTKRAGADTTLKNALRDGAEFAWIPAGDSCAFCTMIASRGWQRMSKAALKNGHAEHLHAHCDCTYAVRFDGKSNVKGYDPQKYRDMYFGAEGNTPQEKINSMRRIQYQENKINSQKRARNADKTSNDRPTDFYAGANKKVLPEKYKESIGDNMMKKYLEEAESDEVIRYIKADFRNTSFIGDGSTASIRKFEIDTGINCGRNGGNHAIKVEALKRQIRKSLLKDISDNDKIFLKKMLKNLEEVSR